MVAKELKLMLGTASVLLELYKFTVRAVHLRAHAEPASRWAFLLTVFSFLITATRLR